MLTRPLRWHLQHTRVLPSGSRPYLSLSPSGARRNSHTSKDGVHSCRLASSSSVRGKLSQHSLRSRPVLGARKWQSTACNVISPKEDDIPDIPAIPDPNVSEPQQDGITETNTNGSFNTTEPLRSQLEFKTEAAADDSTSDSHVSTVDDHCNAPSSSVSDPQTLLTVSESSGDRPFDAFVDTGCLAPIIQTLKAARSHGLPDTAVSHSAVDERPSNIGVTKLYLPQTSNTKSAQQRKLFWERVNTPAFQARLAERSRLPIMAPEVQKQLLDNFYSHDVLILVSGTGSGKTTQVPQILLDASLAGGSRPFRNILCTQPRRISATSIARRVSFERTEPLQKSVGYQIRFADRQPTDNGSILYCTTAVLLKRLHSNPDEILSSYSTVIIDEVHEQSLHTDIVITHLRDLIIERKIRQLPRPKLILMSATIDSSRFADYFMQSSDGKPPLKVNTTHIKGLSYPVEVNYLDDLIPLLTRLYRGESSIKALLTSSRRGDLTKSYINTESQLFARSTEDLTGADDGVVEDTLSEVDMQSSTPVDLVVATIAHIAKTSHEGDILVFLPGMSDIDKTFTRLQSLRPLDIDFSDTEHFQIFKLHSSLQETNDSVFAPVPAGCRRIVLATNIAETSITLPGVVHVIDTGKVRKLLYDQSGCRSEFAFHWISKAGSTQRRGRAGRVQPGHYYALFAKARYDGLINHDIPEMLATDLVGPCLEVKASAIPLDIQTFFSRTPNPPDVERVQAAITTLQSIGALTKNQLVTPLGRTLARLPTHPVLAKAILLGIVFRCLEPMLILACHDPDDMILNHAFDRAGVAASRRLFAGQSESDLWGIVQAMKEYDEAVVSDDGERIAELESECFVRRGSYYETTMIADQIHSLLVDADLIPSSISGVTVLSALPRELNVNAGNIPLVKALALATFQSKLAVWEPSEGKGGWRVDEGPKALMHPRSVNQNPKKSEATVQRRKRKRGDLMVYLVNKHLTGDKYPWLFETAIVTPLMAILFGQKVEPVGESDVLINGWLRMSIKLRGKSMSLPNQQVRSVLLEFRKAIERFLVTTFCDLKDPNHYNTGDPARRPKYNSMLTQDNPLRDVMLEGLVAVLAADNKALRRRNAEREADEEEGKESDAVVKVCDAVEDAPATHVSQSRRVEVSYCMTDTGLVVRTDDSVPREILFSPINSTTVDKVSAQTGIGETG